MSEACHWNVELEKHFCQAALWSWNNVNGKKHEIHILNAQRQFGTIRFLVVPKIEWGIFHLTAKLKLFCMTQLKVKQEFSSWIEKISSTKLWLCWKNFLLHFDASFIILSKICFIELENLFNYPTLLYIFLFRHIEQKLKLLFKTLNKILICLLIISI